MDRREKKQRREKLGQYMDLSNGRFTDHEISRLEDVVREREAHDGRSQTYRSSYKSFDSEGTYRVEDTDTYTFHSDDSGIHVDCEHVSDWDDGQHDVSHQIINTARGILNVLGKLKL